MGGFFDLLCNFFFDLFQPEDEFENRHFVNAIFGLLLFLFTGLAGKALGSWRTGIIALVFIVLCPRIFGHSFNNPKDLPFAALYIFCILQGILLFKEFPVVSLKRSLLLVTGIALACDIRISGLLIIPMVLMFSALYWAMEFFKDKKVVVAPSTDELTSQETQPSDFSYRVALRSMMLVFVMCIAGYFAMGVFWPYIRTNPIEGPLQILKGSSNFSGFDSFGLFDGNWLHRWEIPWYFIPKWLFITLPLFVHAGLFLFPPVLFSEKSTGGKISLWLLVFSALFPIVYVIISKSNLYDDGRHLMFVIPSIVVMAALGADKVLSSLPTGIPRILLGGVFLVLILNPLSFMVRNHPFQAFYFNPIVGGVQGAFKKYEVDYWGSSMKQAVEWIHENIPGNPQKPVRVAMWYGSQTQVKHYLDKNPGYQFVWAAHNSQDWDYCVLIPSYCKFDPQLLKKWPPANTVFQVMADSVPLCAVFKNGYNPIGQFLQKIAKEPTAENYFQLGFEYFKLGQYPECISASLRALEVKPDFADAYNNMGAAFGAMGLLDEEIAMLSKAVQINRKHELALNNLKAAAEKKGKMETGLIPKLAPKVEAEDLVNKSFLFYKLGHYDLCIALCLRAIRIDPQNAMAYNNLTASYNNLRNWKKAIEYGKIALSLNPDYEIARNNLKIAQDNFNRESTQ